MVDRDRMFIQRAFEAYLKRCKIDHISPTSDQYRELRRAYFGGIAQMLSINWELAGVAEKLAMMRLDELRAETEAFWASEDLKHEMGLD